MKDKKQENNIRLILKSFFLVLLFALILTSCEKDDICIEEITPRLIVRFYNNISPEDTKTVSNLSVQGEGNDNLLDLNFSTSSSTTTQLTIATIDSLLVPLITDATSVTYNLTINTGTDNENTDQITITYNPHDEFVSRACGFRTIFNDFEIKIIEDEDNWIDEFNKQSLSIENERSAHVKIFH